MKTRTRWTALFETASGDLASVTVYAAGRIRAGDLALFVGVRRFGKVVRGVALIEEA